MDNKIDERLAELLQAGRYDDSELHPDDVKEYVAEIKQLFKEEFLRLIGEDDNGVIGDTYAFAARERNALRADLRKLVEGEK